MRLIPIGRRGWRIWIVCTAVLAGGGSAGAEEFPFSSSTTEQEFEKGFAEAKGVSEAEKNALEQDRLKIGGYLQGEWQIYSLQNATQDDFMLNPWTLSLYLEAPLRDDVRALFRGRFVHDTSIDEAAPAAFPGGPSRADQSVLEEMKIQFHTRRRVFWTLGPQKIKWGASRYWNPTDFLNATRRDFLRAEDERRGLSLIKAHVPLGNANFYVLALNDKVNETKRIGTAARLELPFSRGEWTVSTFNQRGSPQKWGSDLSFALGDFDIYVEAAENSEHRDRAVSGGLSYEFKYSDDDLAAVGCEAFWQENGTSNKADYPGLVLSGRFVPFYVANSYTLASLYLPSPGRWNDTSWLLSYIQNNNDKSSYARLSMTYSGYRDLSWTVAAGLRSGDEDAETRLGILRADYSVLARVNF